MPPRKALPELKYHGPTKQYCIYLKGRRVTLGTHEPAAKKRHKQICRDLIDGKAEPATDKRAAGSALSVSEALLRYMRDHAIDYYKDQPRTVSRLWEMVDAVKRAHGKDPADSFRGRQLKEVRKWLLEERRCKRTGRPLSRTYVNYLVRSAQRCWSWLLSEGDVTSECVDSMKAVEAIHKGKGGRETRRVLPPPDDWEAALTQLPPTLVAMIRTQQFGGMRPQDVCRMRRCDLSTSPAEKIEFPGTNQKVAARLVDEAMIWVYVPSDHKTAHLDKPRAVPLGPRCQEILRPLLEGLKSTDYIFSPARALAEAGRGNRYKREGYAQRYAVRQYSQIIARAIERSNRGLIEAGVEIEYHHQHWSPNQLRHLQATTVGERFDRSTAAALLGHSGESMIDRYAEQALGKAARAAAECG